MVYEYVIQIVLTRQITFYSFCEYFQSMTSKGTSIVAHLPQFLFTKATHAILFLKGSSLKKNKPKMFKNLGWCCSLSLEKNTRKLSDMTSLFVGTSLFLFR